MGSYTYAHRGHKGFVTFGVASSGAACIYLIGETAMAQNNIYRISFRGSLVEAESVSTFKALSVTN